MFGTNHDNATTLIRKTFPAWMTNGLPSAALGVDMSRSFGAPTVSSMLSSLPITWAADVGEKVVIPLMHGAMGEGTDEDLGKINSMLPSLPKGIMEKYLYPDGMVKDPNRNNQGVYQRDAADELARYFGTHTMKEADASQANWMLTTQKKNIQNIKAHALDQLMKDDISPGEFGKNVDKLIESGMTPSQIMQQVKSRKKGGITTSEERQYGVVPHTRSQFDMYMRARELDRQQEEQ